MITERCPACGSDNHLNCTEESEKPSRRLSLDQALICLLALLLGLGAGFTILSWVGAR